VTIYESHPISIEYNISYGYWINCSGEGSYQIKYHCGLPEVLDGEVFRNQILYPINHQQQKIDDNDVILWDINSSGDNNFKLGIRSFIKSNSYIINDLCGYKADSVNDIKFYYDEITNKYLKSQSINGLMFVDINNPIIKKVSEDIVVKFENNNSFKIAESLFIWLKQNIRYCNHLYNTSLQPSIKTYNIGRGDCDDLSILYISLCRAAGIPSRIIRGILIEKNFNEIKKEAHAWVEVFVGGEIGKKGWIPIECSGNSNDYNAEVHQNFALESAGHLRLFTGIGNNESLSKSISGPTVIANQDISLKIEPFIEIHDYYEILSKELHVNENKYRYYN
jgi:hypothetical protein